jgi:hypothetical protein
LTFRNGVGEVTPALLCGGLGFSGWVGIRIR